MPEKFPKAIDATLDEQKTDTQKTEKAIEVLACDGDVDDSVVDSRREGGIARTGERSVGVWWDYVRSWLLRR
jgi:hypothetical protein